MGRNFFILILSLILLLVFGSLLQRTSLIPNQAIKTASQSASKVTKTYLVTKIIDGDTIEIEGGQKVRYIGINTPETVDPRKVVQCFGKEAARRNRDLVAGKRVHLEKDISETDKFGRLLRYVYVDNSFINELLVAQGFARATSYPPDIKYQDKFIQVEKNARENKRGLWEKCNLNSNNS